MINQKKIFFIIGLGRSGTTLLQEIMNTFTGFCNLKESIVDPSNGINCWSYVRKNNDFTYLERFIQENWTEEFFVEKHPASIFCLPQLLEKYKDANYIFLERSPLKIVLSQINLFLSDESFELRKTIDVRNMELGKDINLNKEQYSAKRVLDGVRNQIIYKNKFQNKITIRYEDFIMSLKTHVELISSVFGIENNFALADACLKQPSASSRKNRYVIKKLSDKYAIEMTKEACRLWNYNYE